MNLTKKIVLRGLVLGILFYLGGDRATSFDDPVTNKVAFAPAVAVAPIENVAQVVAENINPVKVEASVIKTDASGRAFSVHIPDAPFVYELSIPKISVNAGVVATGLEGNRMAVPHNYTDVGWFSLGSLVGENGNAVLGAHVDNGANTPGVFKHLNKLIVGDTMQITDREGKNMIFRIKEIQVLKYNDPDTGAIFRKSGAPGLVLITCAGTWRPAIKNYDKRLIVFAELI
ncbi:class F sortase [Candidatus Parcubacteria bacterium]|nr:class F sortase [Candidatus Parcubacteria bacterium]